MKKTQKGFTLLEAVVSVLLFAILIQGLLQFFNQVYVNSRDLQEKSNLMDNARNVNAFMQEKIREAGYVTIQVDTGGGNYINLRPVSDPMTSSLYSSSISLPGPINDPTSSVASVAGAKHSGTLHRVLIKNDDDTFSAIVMEKLVSPSNKQGKYQLWYKTYDSSGNETGKLLLCDLVEEMKVEMTQDTQYVTFKGIYKKDVTYGASKEIKDSFTESLKYKHKVV